ncbi:MAG: Gldg family protein [Pseudomonadota bacterium]
MSARLFALVATGLSIALFALANLWLQPRLAGARVDFTENRLFTLSQGTRATLENLSEPVDLVFAYSSEVGQDYPPVRTYAARVRELLTAYDSLSGGMLRVREIDPKPFSEEEDLALAAGLTAVATDGPDPLYLGLIGTNAVDNQLVAPFLAPEREPALEYDVTRMIARLDDPAPPVVAIITALPGLAGDGEEAGYFVLREIAKTYDVRPLPSDFVLIPEEVDIVFLAHPADLNARQWDLVDQFILRKGRALIAIDPVAKAATAGDLFNTSSRQPRSDLGRLGRHWGIDLTGQAVADAANALPVEVLDEDGRAAVLAQPLFIAAPPTLMDETDLVTAPIRRPINFGAPGALAAAAREGLSFQPLIITGPAPAKIPAPLAIGDADPRDVVRAYEAGDAPLVLAARLSGTFTTAYPDGPPAGEGDDVVTAELVRAAADDRPERLAESQVPGEVILIADTDLLDDGFYMNPAGGGPIADNATLILNALDNLSGGADLVGLRSRAPSLRPMDRVDRLRRAAEARFFDEQARLETRLTQVTTRLEELQEIGAAGGFFSGDLDADLTEAQRAELIRLREQIVDTRQRLREIERDYRRGVDGLEAWLRTLNIWGGPALIALVAIVLWRRRAGARS